MRQMRDLAINLGQQPGRLADLGEVLGRAGISIEGGGVWGGVAHFLFEDGGAAQRAVEAAGFDVIAVREVLVQRPSKTNPGNSARLHVEWPRLE